MFLLRQTGRLLWSLASPHHHLTQQSQHIQKPTMRSETCPHRRTVRHHATKDVWPPRGGGSLPLQNRLLRKRYGAAWIRVLYLKIRPREQICWGVWRVSVGFRAVNPRPLELTIYAASARAVFLGIFYRRRQDGPRECYCFYSRNRGVQTGTIVSDGKRMEVFSEGSNEDGVLPVEQC